MDDLISRQAAIDAVVAEVRTVDIRYLESERVIHESDAVEVLSLLSSVQPTLYGYNIEHLELIARVLQKANLPPEKVVEALTNIDRIIAIIKDEFEEALRKAVKQCTI